MEHTPEDPNTHDSQESPAASQTPTQESKLAAHFSNQCFVGSIGCAEIKRISAFDPYRIVTEEGTCFFEILRIPRPCCTYQLD